MVNKKTAAKKTEAEEVDEKVAEAAASDEYFGPMLRLLRAGTTVFLPGSSTPLRLESDVQVLGEGLEKDRKWVGMLARDQRNWDLNIGDLEGTWSPVTCTRQEEPPAEETKE